MAAKELYPTPHNLPRRFFVYGSTRDDDDSGNLWTAKFVKGCIKAYDAKIFSYKIYKRKDQNFPFSIKTNNEKDFVVGRVLEFGDKLFSQKLVHADRINGYDVNRDEDKNYYQRVIVNAYLQNDSIKIIQKVKAVSYIQNYGTTPLSECIEIPFNDWMKRHSLNDNDGINIINILNKIEKNPKMKQIQKQKLYKKNPKETNYKQINDDMKNELNDVVINDGEEIGKLKFKNWICSQLGMNSYLKLFQNKDCDSMKYIEFLDESILSNTIGISNKIHIQFMLKEINIFKQSKEEFEKYINDNNELKEYKDELKKMGILTLKDLNNDIKNVHELKNKLNIKSDDIANDLWNVIHPQEGM